jgi:TatD DNase family protein
MTQSNPYIIDSHCHLNYKGLDDDINGVVERAKDAGVDMMLAINTKIHEFDEVLKIANGYPNIFASVGVHPHEAENEPDIALDILLERTHNEKVIGIGETGLDYFYDNAPRDMQKLNFETHIKAAQETGLPLIIHSRDAEKDTFDIMSKAMNEAPYKAVIHCFTASDDFAQKALGLGCYISLSGIVTFKSARDLQETAKKLPLERLLVETDAPYLAPVPHRGKTCEPAFTRNTAEFLAKLRGESLDCLAEATTDNFFSLFSKAKRPE